MGAIRVSVRRKAAKNKRGVRYYLVADHGPQPCWACKNENCKTRHWSPTPRCSKCGEGVELITARREEWIKGRSFDGQREAQHAAIREQERISRDGSQGDPDMTFASFLRDNFLPAQQRREADQVIRANTLATVQVYIETQIIPRLGHIKLRDLRATDLDDFYNHLRREGRLHGPGGLAPKTVRNIAQVTYQALDYAQRKNLLRDNPAVKADTQNVPMVKTETWSAEQVRQFITHEAVTKDRLAAMWQLAALLGLRKSELLGLRWSRVDLEGESVLIDTTFHRHGLDERTKTASSRRRIPLRPELADTLTRHRAAQRAERLRAGEAWSQTHPDHVFTTETGEPIKPDWATRAFKRLCHRVGLPVPGKPGRRGLEGLRHTRASIGPEFGEATAITAAILGHSSGALTLDVYTSIPVEVLRSAQLPGWDFDSEDVRSANR